VYRNANAHSRAYLSYAVQPVVTAADSLAAMSAPGFDPLGPPVIEGALPADQARQLSAAPGAEPSQPAFLHYEDEAVTIRTNDPRASFLVLADQYYPGWEATIDGVSTPIYASNHIFRGVFVPAGEHTVEFTYGPRSFHLGVVVALGTLALAGSALGFAAWRERRARASRGAARVEEA
jgi:hypothetical protein